MIRFETVIADGPSSGLDWLADGRIVEHHATGDFLSVLAQLGALPLGDRSSRQGTQS